MDIDLNDLKPIMEAKDAKDRMLKLITYSISPTIAGHKPSSIICISNRNMGMYNLWKIYGENYVNSIGIEIFELLKEEDRVVVMFYRRENLLESLRNDDKKRFLKDYGYDIDKKLEYNLDILRKRYIELKCPHEMGIFLGIPSDDVEAFIRCSGRDCQYCGYWKVYNNLDAALDTFKKYDSSKSDFLRLLHLNTELLMAVKILATNYG